MTASVNQIHISYVPAHDRLLMRVATETRREIRLWMTRRFVKVLWPVLNQALQSDPAVAGQTDRQTRSEVLSFQHQRAVQDTEFTREYKAAQDTRPLTQTPLLLERAHCEAVDQNLSRLTLVTARGKSFQLTLDRKTIHSVCKLIADCAETAAWDLGLAFAAPAPVETSRHRTIN